MIVKKFYADSTREALRQVRDALGADALILSSREVAGGGVEIMAVAEMEVESVTRRAEAAEPDTIAPESRMAPSPARPELVSEIINEVRELRSLIEGQFAGLAWGEMERREPHKAEIMRLLLSAGFSPALGRSLLRELNGDGNYAQGIRQVRAELLRRLRTVPTGADIVASGGIYALVGPTGVGKTTTVAKLAARCTLEHGPAKVALITTDSYRIGAQDQLRIYGKILGVPVYVVKDENDMELTLADLRSRHLVLIDTVGMSQRDRRLAEQVSLLCGSNRCVKRLLLLAAPSQGNTLEDVVNSYQGDDLDGCILTKIDEAVSLGGLLDVVIRHDLAVHYVTNGQRVPEDMHLANALYLMDRVFRSIPSGNAYALEKNEFPLLMAGSSHG
ncbi:MAG: flagellar biosynthesis protein FlhF [Pseudomonadota bacterium]